MTLVGQKWTFLVFFVSMTGSFRNIIMQYYLVPQWLSSDPKTDDLGRILS